MSRILEFSDGAERGDTSWWTASGVSASQANVIHGAYSYLINSGTFAYKTILPLSELYFRTYVYISSAASASFPIYFIDSASNAQILVLTFSSLSERWNITGGTTGNTGNTSQAMDAWTCLELYYKISDTVGVVTVKINGVQVFTFTGDTKPGAASTIDLIQFGPPSATTVYIDDLAIDNAAWCGLGYYIALTTNAAGDVTQWTPTGGANYANVSIPASDATFNTGATGQLDNYAMTTTTLGAATVERVIPFLRASNPAGGTVNVGLKTETVEHTTAVTTPTSLTWLPGAEYINNPQTGNSWTQAQLDALQFVVDVP